MGETHNIIETLGLEDKPYDFSLFYVQKEVKSPVTDLEKAVKEKDLPVVSKYAEKWKKEVLDKIDEPERKEKAALFLVKYINNCFFDDYNEENLDKSTEIARKLLPHYKTEDDLEAVKLASIMHNEDHDTKYMDIAFEQTGNVKTAAKFQKFVSGYFDKKEKSSETERAFLDNMLPYINRKDAKLVDSTKTVVSDFLCDSFVAKANPANLTNALFILRINPDLSFHKDKQNFEDGKTLEPVFPPARSLIHDQSPEVGRTLGAMVEFYETGDEKALKDTIKDINKTALFKVSADELTDRSLYDAKVTERIDGQESKTTAIKVLRRLVKNAFTEDAPAKSDDKILNAHMNKLHAENSKGFIRTETMKGALDAVTSKLEKRFDAKENSFTPDDVMAIAWVEKMLFKKLQKMDYEKQYGSYKEDWFASAIKFQEMTCSPDKEYSREKTEKLCKDVKEAGSPRQAYRVLTQHTIRKISKLTKELKSRHKYMNKNSLGMLWSGNVNHEIIGLVDVKKATTRIGEKYRNQELGLDKLYQKSSGR